MACFSNSLWTGTDSFPRKRLIIGRLLANLSLTSISRTSVGRDTKLNRWFHGKEENTILEGVTHKQQPRGVHRPEKSLEQGAGLEAGLSGHSEGSWSLC